MILDTAGGISDQHLGLRLGMMPALECNVPVWHSTCRTKLAKVPFGGTAVLRVIQRANRGTQSILHTSIWKAKSQESSTWLWTLHFAFLKMFHVTDYNVFV